jgi:hypothetical protein
MIRNVSPIGMEARDRQSGDRYLVLVAVAVALVGARLEDGHPADDGIGLGFRARLEDGHPADDGISEYSQGECKKKKNGAERGGREEG